MKDHWYETRTNSKGVTRYKYYEDIERTTDANKQKLKIEGSADATKGGGLASKARELVGASSASQPLKKRRSFEKPPPQEITPQQQNEKEKRDKAAAINKSLSLSITKLTTTCSDLTRARSKLADDPDAATIASKLDDAKVAVQLVLDEGLSLSARRAKDVSEAANSEKTEFMGAAARELDRIKPLLRKAQGLAASLPETPLCKPTS